MKPVHGDTVSNDSSSSTWCSYSNQSGLSFKRLPSLQSARTERILHEKYISLKENNLWEKLVKTRVLYEELRHQILSSSLNSPSKGNLTSQTPPLVVGNYLCKANKSKIIQLVDLVDKGVILRPEKLCECCCSSTYNSKAKCENVMKKRAQRVIHTGGYLTSKSSIISKKKAIGESWLEIRFKTKNIKSDPCTFKIKEFMKQKSREALKRNPEVHSLNIDRTKTKSHHKLKRSKPHVLDGVKLSVSKIIKQQTIKDVKKTISVAKKSLETITNHRHFLRAKSCCYSTVTENMPITNSVIQTQKKEINDQTTKDSNHKHDIKLGQNNYMEHWNFKLECPDKKIPQECMKKGKHRIGHIKEYFPFSPDVKMQAKKNANERIEKTNSKGTNLVTCSHNSKVLNTKLNLNVQALSQTIKSKENCSLALQESNAYLGTKNSMLSTSSKRSMLLLSIDSTPPVDSDLLIKAKCKNFRNTTKLGCTQLETQISCYSNYFNSFNNINMPQSNISTNCLVKVVSPNCTVIEKKRSNRNKLSNSSQSTSKNLSNFDFSTNLLISTCVSSDEKKVAENRSLKPDQLRSKMKRNLHHINKRDSETYEKSIVDSTSLPHHCKGKRNIDRKLHENNQKRMKTVKGESHALKRCLCTLRLKALNIKNGSQEMACITNKDNIKTKTFFENSLLPYEVFVCASGKNLYRKCNSWEIQNPRTTSNLTFKSLSALEKYGTITNLLQVKLSDIENCRILRDQKNNFQDSWPVDHKKPETECPVHIPKYQLRKKCLRKCLCSLKLGESTPESNISKTSIMSLNQKYRQPHLSPKTVSEISEFVDIDGKSKKESYFRTRLFDNTMNKMIVVTDDQIYEKSLIKSVKHRRTKSGTFTSQPLYKLLNTKKVQSTTNTFTQRCILKQEINVNQQNKIHKLIGTGSYYSIINELKEVKVSTQNITNSDSKNYNNNNNITFTSENVFKDRLCSQKHTLTEIQKEVYLLINPYTKYGSSKFKLQKNKIVKDNKFSNKREHFGRNNVNAINYSGEKRETKGTLTELLMKQNHVLHHFNEPQRSDIEDNKTENKHRNVENATQRHQKKNEQNIICKSNITRKRNKYRKKHESDPLHIKHNNNIFLKCDEKSRIFQNHKNCQCFDRKSSSVLSVSSTIEIKSENLQSYFQSKIKLFHVNPNRGERLKIKSKFSYEILNSSSTKTFKKENVKQSLEHSLGINTCDVTLNSNDAEIWPSKFFKPVNPHLTGISSLLRRCFCTMNIQVGDGREPRKFPYKLKPYECAPYDCVPYECDPYDCQKRIMKRLVQKVSSTDSSSQSSWAYKHQSGLKREPKQLRPQGKVICTCRSVFSPKSSKKQFKSKIGECQCHRRISQASPSSTRKIRSKSSSVTPMLKRCLCTVKLQRNQGNNTPSDIHTMSTPSTKKDKRRIQNVYRDQTARQNEKHKYELYNTKHVANESEYPELIKIKQKNVKAKRATDSRSLNLSSSSYLASRTKKQDKHIRSVHDKPVREQRKVKSKDLMSKHRPSVTSPRQAVRVGSSFRFSVEFHKDENKDSGRQIENKYAGEMYSEEKQKKKIYSPKRSSSKVISQRDKIRRSSFQNSRSIINTGSQASPIKRGHPSMTTSFLKNCFCSAKLHAIKKKRSSKKAYKNTGTGTPANRICKCKASKCICAPSQCICSPNKCICPPSHSRNKYESDKFIKKRHSVDKASETEKYSPSYAAYKKYHRDAGLETEKRLTKSVSSSATSSKTSKARMKQTLQGNTSSAKNKLLKPTLSPQTVDIEETMGRSSHRQTVRLGSNFSFNIEFYKEQQFPDFEKVQTTAEVIKSTRAKMVHDGRRTSVAINTMPKGAGSSFNSNSSERNTPKKASKALGTLRKCLCPKPQEDKDTQQSNQLLQNSSYKSKPSIHRGTSTPFSRPVPNFHNRGVMTVYKLKTYPYKLAPYECEPGVCIPGECDPYECLKRMNRRHTGSSTDYSTKSAVSMTRPPQRHRDNRVQFSPRERRPQTREEHTKPTRVVRPPPRPQGIEVVQKPRPKTTNRQAVKIGSNFSFNVEFYKDRSQGKSLNIKPCPKPCPEPCPVLCPKTCPKRYMNMGTDACNVTVRNKKAQRRKGQTHTRDSQVFGRKMRSTMTGVGPFLKRCFCTLQLQKRNQKELPPPPPPPRKEERRGSDSSSIGTRTARYRPEPHYREQGTRPRRKQRYHGRRLDPNECEPGVCVPGQCDPYVCLERIKRRRMHSKHAGTGGGYGMHSISSSVTSPGRRHRNRSVSSSMNDYRRARPQKTQMHHRPRKIERPIVKERIPYPCVPPCPPPTSQRQAVRIGSSFSFNIEFYKDRIQAGPPVCFPVCDRRVCPRPPPVKYIKRPVPVRKIRTDSAGSGAMPSKTRSMSSSCHPKCPRDRCMQADSRTLLKRCFCTLKLQKIGTSQKETQESTATIGTYYRTAGSQRRQKQKVTPQYREYGTRSRRRRHHLEPYECEPGVCIPGQCDPYECLERIKRRNLRNSGTGMKQHTRSMSNITPIKIRSASINTPMYRPPKKKYHKRHTEPPPQRIKQPPPRPKQPPPRPSRALENIHNRQAVRLGSSFSFDVEFSKDRTAGVQREPKCYPSICKDPVCTPAKCKTSTCSTSCPVKGNQCKNMQCLSVSNDRRSQARSARTESRGSGVPLLKRCFCTLTLQRAEINSYMIPLRARLYAEKSTSTKSKYLHSESEQQADLLSEYCEPGICMSDCYLDDNAEPIKKRGVRRISRTSGPYMARSRDISGGELGSRFMSLDTQPSKWYSRNQSERINTIVEEPRFQFFNKPNTKQTVRISSNCNFSVEFFKDIIFPEPCDCEEEFDEMSAVTRAIYPIHKKMHKTLTGTDQDEYRKKSKTENVEEHSKRSKIMKDSDEQSRKTKIEKRADGSIKKSKLKREFYEQSKKSKTDDEPEEYSKKSKVLRESDEQSRKTKAEKKVDENIKKSKLGKEFYEHSRISKTENEKEDYSKKSKVLKESDEQSRKTKAEKRVDDNFKKSKFGKELYEHGKKSKTENEPEEHIKKSKLVKELDERSRKTKAEKKTDDNIKKSKLEKDLHELSKKSKTEELVVKDPKTRGKSSINKLFNYLSLNVDRCKCRISENKKYKCFCPSESNKYKCFCPPASKKYKCLCPTAETNGKKSLHLSKKNIDRQPDNVFVSKPVTVARMEMGFQKQKSKSPSTGISPRLRSSKCYEKTQPHNTFAKTNYGENDLFCRNLLKLLKPKYEYVDFNASNNVLLKESSSRIVHLCSYEVLCTTSENVSEDDTATATATVQSLSQLRLQAKQKQSFTILSTSQSEQIDSKGFTLRKKNIFPSSKSSEIESERSAYNSLPISQSRKYSKVEKICPSAEIRKTKSIQSYLFEAGIISRVDPKRPKENFTGLQMQHKILSSGLFKSSELLCYNMLTSSNVTKTKNKISPSRIMLKCLCSFKLRKTKSEDVYYNTNIGDNSMTSVKAKPSPYYKSCEQLQEACGCMTQKRKTKTKQCWSAINIARLNRITSFSIFSPKECWVQYQIQPFKLCKCNQDQQTTSMHSESEEHPIKCNKLETIMPYSPLKFRKSKSKMLFTRKSHIPGNNICFLYCRSSCSLSDKGSSDMDTACICQYRNQFCLNEERKDEMLDTTKQLMINENKFNVDRIKIKPYDTSIKQNNQPRSVVLRTSRFFIKFTTADLFSKRYKSSNDKCTFKTSFRQRRMYSKKHQRPLANTHKVVNLTNPLRTGIKFVKKSHTFLTQRICGCQEKQIDSLMPSKNNIDTNTSYIDDVILRQQSGSYDMFENAICKPDTKHLSYPLLSLPSPHSFNAHRKRDKLKPPTPRKPIPKNTRNHKNPYSYLCCKKKGISKSPRLKRKLKFMRKDEDIVKLTQQVCAEQNILFKKVSLPDNEIGVPYKETLKAGSLDTKEAPADIPPEHLENLNTDNNLKANQVIKNYTYQLFVTKTLLYVHRLGPMNVKNTIRAGYGASFDPKQAYRHFQCILLIMKAAFARKIKQNFRKPAIKCLKYFKHLRNLHKRMLPKPLRPLKKNIDKNLNIACQRSTPYCSDKYVWHRLYPHLMSLVNVWRQLIDVLLFVLWSPCLFSAHLCKAFLCCFLRFRLHCYLK